MRLIKLFIVLAFFFGSAVALAQWRATLNSSTEAAEKIKTNTADPSKYIGSDTCSECHQTQHAFFNITSHSKTLSDKFPVDKQGCEACHGGGRTHAEYQKQVAQFFKDGKDAEATAWQNDAAKFKAATMPRINELSAAAASAICLKCHEGSQGRNDERFNFRRSEHFRHGVSCLDCHSSHAPKRTEFLLKDSEPNMCYQCHAEQKATFAKPFHHKVPEGGMKCSDCHNQHGGFMVKSLRNSVNGDVACVKCHADKQGPFVFEHAPIKTEGCQSCHTPHGSTNPKLLTRNLVKFLCIECHSNTPGIPGDGGGLGVASPNSHDINNPRYANCIVCHSEIHGSNKDRFFR